jgi:hypothetical protein
MVRILSFDVGIKNLSYCLIENESILDWDLINLITEDESKSKSKSKKNSIYQLSSILYKELQGKFEDVAIDHVIIENQPVFKNPTMKTIQILIYSFFEYRRTLCELPINEIGFVGANTKVKFAEDYLQNLDMSVEKVKNKYAYNKRISTLCSQHLIRSQDSLHEWYQEHKKKDDLADAHLLALAYLKRLKI